LSPVRQETWYPRRLENERAELTFLSFFTDGAGDQRRFADEWVPLNPFLGALFRRYCCRTCRVLSAPDVKLQVCSLCKDPAAGLFCCKEPCFAAFWRGGHKNECAGRDKMKKEKKKEGGGEGSKGGAGTSGSKM
jgi:hypothetical protein